MAPVPVGVPVRTLGSSRLAGAAHQATQGASPSVSPRLRSCSDDHVARLSDRPLLVPSTLVDARWAHHAGATSFTRLLLRGLAEVEPAGRWLLWGPSGMVGDVWPGALHVPTSVDPAAWFGQKSVSRVPNADRAIHPHQTRPWHRIPAASCVLDLIQLQEPSLPVRLGKTLRLRASVRAARSLFTINSTVRDELISEFGVDPASVTVLHLPVDREAAGRVMAERSRAGPSRTGLERYLLTVGRFDRHKNLPRLIRAFAHTRFAASGGGLHLVGGSVSQLADLGVGVLPPGVRVLGRLDQVDLERTLAGATALVQASLVEGYGLPVAEALLAQVPVVSSPVPAVTEFGPRGVPTFDPRSEAAITDAIDETIALVDNGSYWDRLDRDSWVATLPTPRGLAQQVLVGLERVVPGMA